MAGKKNTLDSQRKIFRDPTGRMPALAGMETGGYLAENPIPEVARRRTEEQLG